MKPHQQRMCPVIERMVGDMKIRRKAQATIDAYTYHVQRFAEFFGKPLEQASPDDIRSFQLHLIEERRVGWSSYNQVVCGLRLLYTHTHRVPWPVTMVYLRVRRLHLASTPSPLDWLPVRQLPLWQQTSRGDGIRTF